MPVIKSKKEKRGRLEAIIERLATVYPDAPCALEYGGDPWRLLVMARLSAQCTDARVNMVCKELFAKYPNCKAMAEGDLADIERIVKPCGLYKMKAESIKAASAMLLSDFGGEVPSDIDTLLLLPGVGRKIANLVAGDVYGKGAIVCDTHFMRILGRMGMYPEGLRDATKIEMMMRELMDPALGSDFCHRIVIFGREICSARSPGCDRCPLADLCEKRRSEVGKSAHGVTL
jgi:endonuclease-3